MHELWKINYLKWPEATSSNGSFILTLQPKDGYNVLYNIDVYIYIADHKYIYIYRWIYCIDMVLMGNSINICICVSIYSYESYE